MLKWRDELDPYYAKLWLDYTYGGLYNRGVLTERTRLLVAIAQAVAMDEMEVVESHIKSALVHKVKPREILETLLQITVYLGTPKATRAVRVFKKVMTKAGRMKELKVGQLPLDGVHQEPQSRKRTADLARAGFEIPAARSDDAEIRLARHQHRHPPAADAPRTRRWCSSTASTRTISSCGSTSSTPACTCAASSTTRRAC